MIDYEQMLFKATRELREENAGLKARLKNCLNHDSLIATRSELNKKDADITLLASKLLELVNSQDIFTDCNQYDEYRALAKQYIGE